MRLIILMVALFSLGWLTGCSALLDQPFSCAPSVSTFHGGDMELFKHPSTTAGTGYPHC